MGLPSLDLVLMAENSDGNSINIDTTEDTGSILQRQMAN